MSGSREGFLSKGVTAAALNLAGKVPSEKEKFASLAMSSENTDGQSLSKDVGMKSTEDDLDGMDAMSLRTPSTVTSAMQSNDLHKCTGSWKGMNVRQARVKEIVRFSDDILSEKKIREFFAKLFEFVSWALVHCLEWIEQWFFDSPVVHGIHGRRQALW